MFLYDTHFHLDLCPKPEEMIAQIEEAKIYTIAVTNAPSVFFYTQKVTSDSKYVRAALGLHPELAAQRKNEIEQFTKLISETKYIGEIGLDNQNKSKDDYSIQKEVFQKILTACADKKEKILTVHSRRASTDVISMIGNNFPGKVILHWYSGSKKDVEVALKYGFYFSINYPMLNSRNGNEIIKRVPLERILIETDGPFTTHGNLPFNPLMCSIIVEKIIENRTTLTREQLCQNFVDLLSKV